MAFITYHLKSVLKKKIITNFVSLTSLLSIDFNFFFFFQILPFTIFYNINIFLEKKSYNGHVTDVFFENK